MTPTWYEILGVGRDASREQIKTAWRDALDRFEPGTPQFRMFNEAADTLLDPEKRDAYDATLPTEPVTAAEPVVNDEPVDAETVSEETVDDEPVEDSAAKKSADPAPATKPAGRGRRVPSWALAALALLCVLSLVAAGVLWKKNSDYEAAQAAGKQATSAAERALPFVLSFDYRQLDADRKRAIRYLTPAYTKEYNSTFELVKGTEEKPGGAIQTKSVVKATVVDTAVVDATADRARIVVFLDQATRKAKDEPVFSLNRLAVSMRKSDSGSWLVDDISSY